MLDELFYIGALIIIIMALKIFKPFFKKAMNDSMGPFLMVSTLVCIILGVCIGFIYDFAPALAGAGASFVLLVYFVRLIEHPKDKSSI